MYNDVVSGDRRDARGTTEEHTWQVRSIFFQPVRCLVSVKSNRSGFDCFAAQLYFFWSLLTQIYATQSSLLMLCCDWTRSFSQLCRLARVRWWNILYVMEDTENRVSFHLRSAIWRNRHPVLCKPTTSVSELSHSENKQISVLRRYRWFF